MIEFIVKHEIEIRLGAFLSVFLSVAIWEVVWPRRQLLYSKPVRWYANLGITLINSVSVRWLIPTLPVGMAFLAQERGWGLFNNIHLPFWLVMVLAVAALDLTIYLQHVLFHSIPALWRLHGMHHSDLDFDVTTGSRFHPLEIVLSTLIKLTAVVVIGAPALAVLIFEIMLNATSMFNHGNLFIPLKIDRLLRWIMVTPDMHRVHHSMFKKENNTNFGFSVSWWDRLLGTYCDQPQTAI